MLVRRRDPELMDDPGLPPGEHRRALAGLARINILSNARGSVWRGVKAVVASARHAAVASLSVLDLASGSGDVAVGVALRAAALGWRPRLHLLDISAEALDAASRRASARGVTAALHRVDVRTSPLPFADGGVDVVTCSLFLHHLDRPEAVGLLREMARVARLGVVVNDLVRCHTGLFAAKVAGSIVTRSPVVRVDSVRSVRAAWTPDELADMAAEAGLRGTRIDPVFPMRMTLVWSRP